MVSRRYVWHFWASKCGSLFQVPIRIVVLLAESRASNRVMTSGARTMPLSPAAATKGCLATQHQNVAAPAGCESSSGFQEPGSRDPVPHPHCLLLKYRQTDSTHTFWSSAVSVSCSIVLFVKIHPAFPLCLSNWFKTSLRGSRDRSSVKGGANNYLLRTRRRGASNIELGGNRLCTFIAARLLFAKSFMLKTRSNHD